MTETVELNLPVIFTTGNEIVPACKKSLVLGGLVVQI
jgi:hypothetical protein